MSRGVHLALDLHSRLLLRYVAVQPLCERVVGPVAPGVLSANNLLYCKGGITAQSWYTHVLLLLQSPSKVPATCRLALPAAQIKTAAIKPDLPQAPSSSAPTASPQPSALRDQSKPPTESMSDRPYSPDASQEAELTQQPQQLGADLGPEASVPQDAQAISQQKAAAVGTAVPSLTTADHSSKSPSQKDSGQAVMFMFPQELAHPPASCDQALESQAVLLDATGATVSPVSPHRPAASQVIEMTDHAIAS